MSTLTTWKDLQLWQLPAPRIRKIIIDRHSSDGNLTFNLDIDIEGPFRANMARNSRNNSFLEWIKNSNLKIAIIFFEVANSDSTAMHNFIRDIQDVSFLPIASDLILQSNPEVSYSKRRTKGHYPLIKVMSLEALAEGGSVNIENNHPSAEVWTAQISDLKFTSNHRNLNHASFCVIPFINISNTTSSRKKKYSKSSIGLLKAGARLFQQYVGNYVDPQNIDKCLLYNYYSFDHAVAIENGNVKKNGFLMKRTDNNTFYTGPWHTRSDGSPRIGKFPGDRSLKVGDRDIRLKKIPVPCGRIQDHRSTNKSSTGDWSGWEEEGGLKSLVASIQRSLGAKKSSFTLKTDPSKTFVKDFTTIDKMYNFNTLFTIDMPNLVLANTSLPAAMKNIMSNKTDDSRTALKAIMSACTIQHCEIHRREIRTDVHNDGKLTAGSMIGSSMRSSVMSGDMLVLTSDVAQSPKRRLIFSDANPGMFKEIKNLSFQKDDMSNLMRTFSFREGINPQNSRNAQYQYKIFLSIKDGVVTYATNLILDLIEKYAIYVKAIAPVLALHRNNNKFSINNIKGKYGKKFISNFNTKNLVPLLDSLSRSIRFFAGKPINYNEIETSFFMRANFVTGDMAGVQTLRDAVEDLVGSFSKMTDLNLTAKNAITLQYNESNQLVLDQIPSTAGTDLTFRSKISNRSQVSSLKNTIKHTENFESVLNNTVGGAYEYIFGKSNNSNGIGIITQADFVKRHNRELNKYYEPKALKEAMAAGSTNFSIEENQTRFFTPSSFKLGSRFYKIPPALNVNTLTATYSYLLDILYHKEGTGLVADQNELNVLTSKMNSITIESMDIRDPNATKNRVLRTDTGTWEQKVDAQSAVGESWKNLEEEQGATIDQVVKEEDYVASLTQNSGLNRSVVMNGILGNQVLSKKVPLVSIFSRPTDFVKRKAYSRGTPPQMISALLRFSSQQIMSGPTQAASKTNVMTKSLRNGEMDMSTLNVKSLNNYGYWWFNYDNMVEVQFCASMDMLNGTQWLPLTNGTFSAMMENGSALLCRLVKKVDPSLNQVKNTHIDLPIFNEYFIIQPSNPVNEITIGTTLGARTTSQKDTYKIAGLINKYSDDFYKFVQSDRGQKQVNKESIFRMNFTKGAVNAILEKDPTKISIKRKTTSTTAATRRTSVTTPMVQSTTKGTRGGGY